MQDALKRCGDLIPRAIFPVHLTGQSTNQIELKEFAENTALKFKILHALW